MSKAKTEKSVVTQNVFKNVVSIVPVGNQVLVERLNESELINSSLLISTDSKPSNQGYILAIGPMVSKELNLKVGDRVFLQGSYVPVPNFDNSSREKNLLYPDMIKAILNEE